MGFQGRTFASLCVQNILRGLDRQSWSVVFGDKIAISESFTQIFSFLRDIGFGILNQIFVCFGQSFKVWNNIITLLLLFRRNTIVILGSLLGLFSQNLASCQRFLTSCRVRSCLLSSTSFLALINAWKCAIYTCILTFEINMRLLFSAIFENWRSIFNCFFLRQIISIFGNHLPRLVLVEYFDGSISSWRVLGSRFQSRFSKLVGSV